MKKEIQKAGEALLENPVPKKKVGIIHMEMVRETRSLYGMEHMNKPEEAAEMIRPLLERADREIFLVLSLSTALEPMALEIVAVGGLNCCPVDVGAVFKHSILNNAASIICFHNHPSGQYKPSLEDLQITRRLKEAGDLLGISLRDHIILGRTGYYSFQEQGLLENKASCQQAGGTK